MGSKSVSLISSSHKIIQTFLAESTAMGIRVPRILELSRLQRDQAEQVDHGLAAAEPSSQELGGALGDLFGPLSRRAP